MRSLVVLLAVSGLLCSSVVLAAPRTLSSAELDRVTAGNAADPYISAFVSGDPVVASSDVSGTIDPLTTTGNGSPTVAGDGNTTAGAVADNTSSAIDGDGNLALGLTQNGNIGVDGGVAGNYNSTIELGDSDSEEMVGNVSAKPAPPNPAMAVQAGDINITDAFKLTTTDNEIEKGGVGVIGDDATVTNSFNTQDTDNDVDVDIDGSFNTHTNTLTISGQDTVSGIVNASALGDQNIGANLNLTSATSSVPNTQPATTGLTTLAGFGAAAFTCLDQTVVNESAAVLVGDVTVVVADIGLPLTVSRE